MNSSLCRLLMSVVCLFLFPVTSSQAYAPASAGRPQLSHTIEALHTSSPPVMFIQNVGQYDPSARFLLPAGDHDLWLSEDGIRLTLRARTERDASSEPAFDERLQPSARAGPDLHLKLSFSGANLHPRMVAFDRLETRISYFLGNDPAEWRTDVPVWGGVRYENLYPGLDMEVAGADGHWSWRLVPGDESRGRWQASPAAVRLAVVGAGDLVLAGDSLSLETALGEYRLPLLGMDADLATPGLPRARIVNRTQVLAPFAPQSPNAAEISSADRPEDLSFATFLGGASYDNARAVAVDGSRNAYVTGKTESSDFPADGYDTEYNEYGDVFVVKLDATGTGLSYATFLGGSASDDGRGIAVDGSGNAYIAGTTGSSDFPATGYDTSFNGGSFDAYVVKLNAAGDALSYATFLGGSANDNGMAIALNSDGEAFVAGSTNSSDFPAASGPGYDTGINGGYDAFVTRLNSGGTALSYATFLGGSAEDGATGIALDSGDNAYVAGYTYSSDFPAASGPGYDTSHNGSSDAFTVKLGTAGTALTYATFVGGAGYDYANGIAVDTSGNAVVVGETISTDFPAASGPGYDTSFNGGTRDAFAVKLGTTGTTLAYATYLGGTLSDNARAVAVDAAGNACLTGETGSSDFPASAGPGFDTSFNGSQDAFVLTLDTLGTSVKYATFLGGSGEDSGWGIALDHFGNAYVVGRTYSADFPAASGPGYDTTKNASEDAFAVKLWADAASFGEQVYVPVILRD